MSYYTEKTLQLFSEALEDAKKAVRAGDIRVRISRENSKMGPVASVSMLPYLTCPARCRETCGPKCYAAKLAVLRANVRDSWAHNTALAMINPEAYWQGVREAVRGVRFFRFHVAGDILSAAYLAEMIATARDNPHTEILAFTKRFELVNRWINSNGPLPANLHLLFSGWTNLDPINPHSLPETNVIPRGEDPADSWKICGGNCFSCACRGVGCWQAQQGDVIAFRMH